MSEIVEALESAVETLQDNMNRISEANKGWVSKVYSFYPTSRFYYLKEEDDNIIIFGMLSRKFKDLEYYCGFEYEREHIRFRLEHGGMTFVGYDASSSRVSTFYDAICEDEEEEEEEEEEEIEVEIEIEGNFIDHPDDCLCIECRPDKHRHP